MDIEKEKLFFDQFAQHQGDYDVLAEAAYARLMHLFKRYVQPKPSERCVDLGCGTGAFTRRLRPFGLKLTGVDISASSVELANRHAHGEAYVVGDIRRTDFPDCTFDIAMYSGVLHHCDTYEARIAVLKEGFRILRPGGRLFAYDPNAHSPSMWLYRDPRSPFYSSKGKTDNEVLLNRRDLAAEIRTAGFQEVMIRGVSGITFRYVAGRLAMFALPAYNLYEQLIRFSPLERRFGTFLISVAKRLS